MKVYSVIIMILLLFLASFLMGYNFAARNYELKIAQLEQQAKDYENKVLTSTLETERKNQELVVQQTEKVNNDVKKIDDDFKRYSNELNSDSLSDSGSPNKVSLSTTSTTTDNLSTCKCRYTSADNRKLKAIKQRQLEIAKDCDIAKSKLNSLIMLYNSARENTIMNMNGDEQ